MPRKKKTCKRDRLKQYKDLAWQLRMACRITLNQAKAVEVVDEIVKLHIKFEREDDDGGEWGN